MESQDQQFEMALAEIRLASPDLADFLVWAAHQGEESDDAPEARDFVGLCDYVLSYAQTVNAQSAAKTVAEERSGEG